jgi:DNA primase
VEKAKKLSREDAFSYLVEMFSIDFGNNKFSLVRRYEDEAEAPPRFVLSKAALAAYPMDVNDGIGYRAANYYLQIDKATADRFRFGYRLKDHRLVFPVWHSDGALGGLIGRSMLLNCSKANRWRNFDPERFKREFVLMGAELAVDKSKPMIVVEGPRDFFKIRSLGWDNVRATLGASASAWQIETLASYGTDIVPLYDMDRAGEEGRRTLRRRLNGRAAMLSFVFPPEAVDPATGKNDPAALDAGSLRSLVSSFKRSFNFAYVQRTPPTPR